MLENVLAERRHFATGFDMIIAVGVFSFRSDVPYDFKKLGQAAPIVGIGNGGCMFSSLVGLSWVSIYQIGDGGAAARRRGGLCRPIGPDA